MLPRLHTLGLVHPSYFGGGHNIFSVRRKQRRQQLRAWAAAAYQQRLANALSQTTPLGTVLHHANMAIAGVSKDHSQFQRWWHSLGRFAQNGTLTHSFLAFIAATAIGPLAVT